MMRRKRGGSTRSCCTFSVTLEQDVYGKIEVEAKRRHIPVREYAQNIILLHAMLELPKGVLKPPPPEHYTAQNDDEPI